MQLLGQSNIFFPFLHFLYKYHRNESTVKISRRLKCRYSETRVLAFPLQHTSETARNPLTSRRQPAHTALTSHRPTCVPSVYEPNEPPSPCFFLFQISSAVYVVENDFRKQYKYIFRVFIDFESVILA